MKLFEKIGEGAETAATADLKGLGDRISLELKGQPAHVQFESVGGGRTRVVAEILLGRVPYTAENAALRKEVLARVGHNGYRDTGLRLDHTQRLFALHSDVVPKPETGIERATAATIAILPLMPFVREFTGFLPSN